MDIDKTTFDEGIENWINMYKKTGKTEEKKITSYHMASRAKLDKKERKDFLF